MNWFTIGGNIKMKLTIKEMSAASLCAALTAVLSQISISVPLSPVPFTLQTFAVFLSAAVFGRKIGLLSQVVYIILGITGLPVFAGFESGPATIIGPKGGYLISFPIIPLVTAFIMDRFAKKTVGSIFLSLLAGLIPCYVLGTLWLGIILKLSVLKAIIMGTGLFVVFDIIKALAVSYISVKLQPLLSAGRFS